MSNNILTFTHTNIHQNWKKKILRESYALKFIFSRSHINIRISSRRDTKHFRYPHNILNIVASSSFDNVKRDL